MCGLWCLSRTPERQGDQGIWIGPCMVPLIVGLLFVIPMSSDWSNQVLRVILTDFLAKQYPFNTLEHYPKPLNITPVHRITDLPSSAHSTETNIWTFTRNEVQSGGHSYLDCELILRHYHALTHDAEHMFHRNRFLMRKSADYRNGGCGADYKSLAVANQISTFCTVS